MIFDNAQVASKLRRWEKYLNDYRLPEWKDIPDIGLYMEQVLALLCDYLDYLPPELKGERFITAATINNYVRKGVMPKPQDKRYYRIHLAYLIIICSLKQSLSIPTIQTIAPVDLEESALERIYTRYRECHSKAAALFVAQTGVVAAGILHNGRDNDFSTSDTYDLITTTALTSGFGRLMAEKLIPLGEEEDASDAATAVEGQLESETELESDSESENAPETESAREEAS